LIYFDNNATTPVDKEVAEVILKYMTELYANPNSIHSFGVQIEQYLEESRKTISEILQVLPTEIFFTSCATESINTVIRGVARANKNIGKRIITSTIEHSAVINTLKDLERNGFDVIYINVDKTGVIDLEQLANSINQNTILVSLMLANNEIGTIEPINEAYNLVKKINSNTYFHIDAVQALGKIPFNIEIYKCDFASFSAHKFHGPKGVGILYKKRGTRMYPLLTGGTQENAMRAGTQNVPGIIGTALALEKAVDQLEYMKTYIKQIRNYLADNLEKIGAKILTPLENSIPNTLGFFFPNIRGDIIVNALSEEEIFVSTTSACASKTRTESRIMKSLGYDDTNAKGLVRISLSHLNNLNEAEIFLNKLKNILNFLNYWIFNV